MFQVDIRTQVQKKSWPYHSWHSKKSNVWFPVIPIHVGLIVARQNSKQTTASTHDWCWYKVLLTAGNPSLCNCREITATTLNTSPRKVIVVWHASKMTQLEDLDSSCSHPLLLYSKEHSVEFPTVLKVEIFTYYFGSD